VVLLAASQLAYTMLRWIGAAYLLWVGYTLLRHPRREFPTQAQGADVGAYILMLGAIQVLLDLIWFACLIAATRPTSAFIRRPAVVQACDRLTGGVLIAFGVGLALESRRT
jgi:threonine/homoserine/homoserine lactone efflux protein